RPDARTTSRTRPNTCASSAASATSRSPSSEASRAVCSPCCQSRDARPIMVTRAAAIAAVSAAADAPASDGAGAASCVRRSSNVVSPGGSGMAVSGRCGKYAHASRGCKPSQGCVLGRPRTCPVRGLPASLPCSFFAGESRPYFPERPLVRRRDQGEQALVFFGAGGAAGEMGSQTRDGRVGVLAGELELDVAVDEVEAFVAADLRPRWTEKTCECLSGFGSL